MINNSSTHTETRERPPQGPRDQRILVVSDLHMTAGRNRETGGWSPTEDFFQDDEFARFLEHYSNAGAPPTTLVINGDLFDFLQVLELPSQWRKDHGAMPPPDNIYVEELEWHGTTYKYRIPLSDINPKYGLRCTRESTRFLAGKIVEGHETFFCALVRFASRDANRIVILKGNHDVQLYWDAVQGHILDRLEVLASVNQLSFARTSIAFEPWFFYEKDLVWIEHGNQYEYTTSFVNFLVPTLPFVYDATGSADGDSNDHIELDFSSFLVRYLTNPGEPINPLADNIRPLTRYWEGMWREHPFFVLGTVWSGVVFILKAFDKARTLSSRTRSRRSMSDANLARLKREASFHNVPEDVLIALDNCKQEPTMAKGPLHVIWWFFKPMVVAALWLLPLLFVTANVTKWFPDPPEGTGAMGTRTLMTLLQGLAIIATGALSIGARQLFGRLKSAHARDMGRESRDAAATTTKTPTSPKLIRSPSYDMRTMSTYITRLLDVRYVSFGHTHYADVYHIEDGGRRNDCWYFNTGTWMTVLEPREQLYREARQLTFLEINQQKSGESHAELKCWHSPIATRPVVVIDTEELDNSVENGILLNTLRSVGSRVGGGK